MNAIQLLATYPAVDRLGATLLHFLWQGLLVAAVYTAVRFAARGRGPGVRYAIACAALAIMAAAPVATWFWLSPPESVPSSIRATTSAAASTAIQTAVMWFPAGESPVPSAILPWVVSLWLAGVTALCSRLFGGWVLTMRLRSRLVRPAPAEWQQALRRLAARLGVSRRVRLLVSSWIQAPASIGWLRPVILVPVGALAGLPPEQVEALLLHELAHIRRHDYLVNILQSAIEALLFYHPAVWWVSGHIRAERELCCDDAAVSITGDAVAFARALAGLQSSSPSSLGTAIAANGGSVADRIARLLGRRRPATRSLSAPGALAAGALLALAAYAVFAQPVARLKFEAASIKPSNTRSLSMIRPLPGRLSADANVRLLIQSAYHVQPFQIVDAPPAIAERYGVEATAGRNVSRAELFAMLQSLLEDRWHLKLHRETRELPVYALSASRGGLKLPPPKDGGCVNPAADEPLDWAGGRMAVPDDGPLPAARCGSASVLLQSGSGARIQGGSVAMPELARALSLVLGRSVIDRTGSTGLFDVRLDFLPDATTPAIAPPPPDAQVDPNYVSIVTAVQQQLGLRLESTRGPVEVLVVDRLEKPSAN